MRGATGSDQPTLADLARQAGVSKATVSRALSGSPEVSEATRQRIRALAWRTGYRIDARARALATRRTQTIGLVIPRTARFIFANPYFSQLIEGIGEVVDAAGYHILLSTSTDPLAFRALFLERRVDGLLMTASAVPVEALDAVAECAEHCPLVLINQPFRRIPCMSVAVDNVMGIEQVVQHLVQRGHHRIAFIASPDMTVHGRERRRAFIDATASYASQVEVVGLQTGDDTESGGTVALGQLLEHDPTFDALVCSNDLMAIGAMQELMRHGRNVPKDVAVVGFDDIRLASLVRPALTTVRQPVDRAGRVAAQLLLQQLERPDASLRHDQVQLATELVVRDSG